jgi:hypothetical protein
MTARWQQVLFTLFHWDICFQRLSIDVDAPSRSENSAADAVVASADMPPAKQQMRANDRRRCLNWTLRAMVGWRPLRRAAATSVNGRFPSIEKTPFVVDPSQGSDVSHGQCPRGDSEDQALRSRSRVRLFPKGAA